MARKSLYKPELCNKLIEHMKEGLSFAAFGAIARVSRNTLYAWLEAHPDFKEAKEEAELHCLLFWEKQGISGLFAGKQFNVASWVVNMANRFEWSHRPREDVGEKQNAAATPISMSDDQLLKLVEAARGEPK